MRDAISDPAVDSGVFPDRSVAAPHAGQQQRTSANALYTADQKARRDATPWTLVQGVLAPVQFLIFAISLVLVVRYLTTGQGHAVAVGSVVVKTLALYAIMLTGCIWEKVVFDRWLFAPIFFWEDVFSMLVLALHTAYLVCLAGGLLGDRSLMFLALAAYATYAVNATQFVLKLRAARRGGVRETAADEAHEWAQWAS